MKRVVRVIAPALLLAALAACGGGDEPNRGDVPREILDARPSISLEEAQFVLDAREGGVDISGASVGEDIETAKTICWTLKEGGVQVGDIASQLTEDDALRTKRLMKAAIEALCPEFQAQVNQLKLPE